MFIAIVTPVDTSHSLRSRGLLSRILVWILDQLLLSLLNRSLLLLRRFFLKFRCPLPHWGLLAIWGLLKGFWSIHDQRLVLNHLASRFTISGCLSFLTRSTRFRRQNDILLVNKWVVRVVFLSALVFLFWIFSVLASVPGSSSLLIRSIRWIRGWSTSFVGRSSISWWVLGRSSISSVDAPITTFVSVISFNEVSHDDWRRCITLSISKLNIAKMVRSCQSLYLFYRLFFHIKNRYLCYICLSNILKFPIFWSWRRTILFSDIHIALPWRWFLGWWAILSLNT